MTAHALIAKADSLPGAILSDSDVYPPVAEATAPALRTDPDAAAAWLCRNREAIDGLLLERGVVKFRGFAIPTSADFARFIAAYPVLGSGYSGGTSPRAVITGSVMEATQTPGNRELPLHQEMAYAPRFPPRIAFYCEQAAPVGGETDIGDMRNFTQAMDPAFLARVRERGILYRRFFRDPEWAPGHPDLDIVHRTWQDTFDVTDRHGAEQACDASGCAWEWVHNGLLVSYIAKGVEVHPETDDEVWFNSLAGFHFNRQNYGDRMFDLYHAHYGNRHRWPYELTYGDGGAFEEADVMGLYPVQSKISVRPDWRNGDVMLLDNILTAHGRNTYSGERKVRVALLC